MSVYKYETNTFSISDDKRFNKWINENKSYDLSASPIGDIFAKESLQVDISPDTYKGLSLAAGSTYDGVLLTEKDVQAYFSKYPHHDASLTDSVYYGYIKALKNGQSTLDTDLKGTLPSNPEEGLPDGGSQGSSTIENTNPDGTPQTKLPDAPPAYIIRIKSDNYPDEVLDDGDIKYRFLVSNTATNLYEHNVTIPGSLTKGFSLDTDEQVKNLAKAYFKDLVEKYPNYELIDNAGLFSDTGGDLITGPETEAIDEDNVANPAPYLETTYDDQRYSERIFIGVNNLEKTNPFDIPTTMGYLLFSEKMIKDYLSTEKHWIELLTSYTVPQVTVKPSKSSKKDKSDQLGKKDFSGTRGENDLLGENIKINDFESKLNKYNLEKLKKQFAGNTAFPDLENGINKLRGNENIVASVYGEVLHRINIRELLVRAMACLVAKLKPGDWVEMACKTIVKEVAKQIGFNKVKKIILEEWDTLTKSIPGGEELKNLKKKLEQAEKSGALVDRKLSKNLTIIDGKDPFSQEFGKIQNIQLQKEKEMNISNKLNIDNFVKDIKDFIDLDALCERFGEFINDATKLLFAPGGLGFIKNNLRATFPGLPQVPTIKLPHMETKDIMRELIEAMERAAKEMVVQAIVDLVKGIIDEALAQCEDVLTPPPIISPDSSITIPDLVPNTPGAASPVNYDNIQSADIDDLGIPNHMALAVKELLDWIAQYLKPNQLCKLLSGTASQGLLRTVLSQVEQRFENLSLYIRTTGDVHRLFKRLGEKVDQTFCTAVVSNVSAISDLCEDTVDSSIHADALKAKGFNLSEIDQILTEDRDRKLDALEKLTEYFVDPDTIQTQVPAALCTPSKEGLIPKNPSALTYNVETAVETIFDSVKYNFEQDSDNLKEEYIKMGPVITDRFKVPEPGEDFSKEFRAIPITTAIIAFLKTAHPVIKDLGPVGKTGKYFLIDASKDVLAQVKSMLAGSTITSEGSEIGILGPIYVIEQKRMVLPDLKDVFHNTNSYLRSTHYKQEFEKPPGDLTLINDNKDPEAETQTPDLGNPNKPMNLFFKSPGFNVAELKVALDGVTKQINNSDELDAQVKASLVQQQSQLQSVINSANQSINNIVLTLPTVQQSIQFVDGTVTKIHDNYGLTVNEQNLQPYEEKLLGVGSNASGPGYISLHKGRSKTINPDSDVGTLVQELLTDVGDSLESSFAADPFKNSNNNFLDDPSMPGTQPVSLGAASEFDDPWMDPSYKPSGAGDPAGSGALLGDNEEPELQDIINAPPPATGVSSYNKYKDNYKAFKAVMFAKLISRKYKKAVIEAHANNPSIEVDSYNKHFYYLDNTLISLYERQLFNLTSRLGFNPFKESPLMDIATFEKFDITPDDPEDLASNKCLPENSAGSSAPDSLLDIDAIKKFVSDNYQRKTCIARNPGDLNPLKESMLEAGILTMIKVSFIEYCFNSLIALTTGKITQNFVNELTVNTIADKFDEQVSRAGAVTSDIVYSTIVKYLRDQLKLNIDLLDPMTPDNLLLQITDINITERKALKFLCKKIILETLPTIDTLISDVKYDFNISGLEGLLGAYNKTPNNFFNPPAAMNAMIDDDYETVIGSGPQAGRIYKFDKVAPPPGEDPHPFIYGNMFVENLEFHTSPNITFDPKYDSEILSNEKDPFNGMFFLEKYIRIEYLDPDGKQFFFITGDATDAGDTYQVGVTSFENFERMVYFQYALQYSMLPLMDKTPYLEKFGIEESKYNLWKDNTPFSNTFNIASEPWTKYIKFKVGARLMYKMPSDNLLPLKKGEQPFVGEFIKHSPIGKINSIGNPNPVYQSETVKKEFEKIQFREASYIVRTVHDPTQPIYGLFFLNGVIAIKDHLVFPVAEYEEDFSALNSAAAGGYDDFHKFVLGNKSAGGSLSSAFGLAENGIVGNPEGKKVLPKFDKMKNLNSLNVLPLVDPSVSYNELENKWNQEEIFNGLLKTPEVRLLTEHILPPELFKSLASEYMYVFPKSRTIPNSYFFNQTRSSLVSLFNAAVHGDDFKYRDPGGSEGLGKHKQASKRRSTQINILPSIQKLALQTVPMIVKGMAETLDPAVSLANKITIATGQDPKNTIPMTLALMPPPLFPPFGFNSIPITPLGLTYLALGFSEPFTALIDNKKNKKECDDESSEDKMLNSSEETGEGAASEELDLDGLK